MDSPRPPRKRGPLVTVGLVALGVLLLALLWTRW